MLVSIGIALLTLGILMLGIDIIDYVTYNIYVLGKDAAIRSISWLSKHFKDPGNVPPNTLQIALSYWPGLDADGKVRIPKSDSSLTKSAKAVLSGIDGIFRTDPSLKDDWRAEMIVNQLNFSSHILPGSPHDKDTEKPPELNVILNTISSQTGHISKSVYSEILDCIKKKWKPTPEDVKIYITITQQQYADRATKQMMIWPQSTMQSATFITSTSGLAKLS